MMTSFHSLRAQPGKSFLLFFRLFRIGWLPPVVLIHRRVDALRPDQLHSVSGFTDHFCRYFQLRRLHRPQHVFFAAAQRMIRSATSRSLANSSVPTELITDFAPLWLPALPPG